MAIDFELETTEITDKLKEAEGYLDCEKIIIYNIKKQLDKGLDEESIKDHLSHLWTYFKEEIENGKSNIDYTNYRYAAGFVNTLLKMPFWKSWIETNDM